MRRDGPGAAALDLARSAERAASAPGPAAASAKGEALNSPSRVDVMRDVAGGGERGGEAEADLPNDKPESVRFDGADEVEFCDKPGVGESYESLVGRRSRGSLSRRGGGERELCETGAGDGDTEVADNARRLCFLVRSLGDTDLDSSRLGGVAAEQ